MLYFFRCFMLLVALCAMPGVAMATTGNDGKADSNHQKFSKTIDEKADSISNLLFGPIAKIVGVLGAGYGMITSIISASWRPLISFAGIGLSINLIPKFIENVFTALLP